MNRAASRTGPSEGRRCTLLPNQSWARHFLERSAQLTPLNWDVPWWYTYIAGMPGSHALAYPFMFLTSGTSGRLLSCRNSRSRTC